MAKGLHDTGERLWKCLGLVVAWQQLLVPSQTYGSVGKGLVPIPLLTWPSSALDPCDISFVFGRHACVALRVFASVLPVCHQPVWSGQVVHADMTAGLDCVIETL